MAKPRERQKALDLRKQGKSYSQIKKEIDVSKSTLSYWLREYPLSRERIRLLRDLSEVRIEKYRKTMRRKKEERLLRFYEEEKKRLLPLTKRELLIAGLFLYWGEGVKGFHTRIGLNNTDPKVVKFYLHWMNKALGIPREKIKVYLHLYSDMNIEKEREVTGVESLTYPLINSINLTLKRARGEEWSTKGLDMGLADYIFTTQGLKRE